MDRIVIGQYFETSSVMHRMDPRVKIVLGFLYIVAIFVAPSWWGLAVMALFTCAVVGISRVPLRVVMGSVVPLLFILVFAVLLNLLFTKEGAVYWHWGIFTVTDIGCYKAAFYPSRMALILLGMTLITLTTSPIELTDGMEALIRPLSRIGVPAHELAMMTGIAMRFLPVFIDELGKIRHAQESRGADFGEGGPIRRMRSLVPLMVPLFMSAFRHAENLGTAMESRCYHGGDGRTRLHRMEVERRDVIAMVVYDIVLAAVIAMRILLS